MTRYDRDELLARIDLEQLADELLGPHRGRARSPSWPCPLPTHAQTGRTPPVSIFRTRWGDQRWHCHGCGACGTAIDLVMQANGVDVRDAMDWLADRSGLQLGTDRAPPRIARRPAAPEPQAPDPRIEDYVAACEALLWSPAGRPAARWLTETRSLPEDVLRANRIGYDPGAHRLDRPDGVPRAPGVVLPVLDPTGRAIFTQTRRLGTSTGPRYLNCASRAAPNPRIATYRLGSTDAGSRCLIVCEGAFDALSAVTAGHHAAAVLGTALADHTVADRLSRTDRRPVIAFDADHAGDLAATRLDELLHERGAAPRRLRPPEHAGDLNAWHRARANVWSTELQAALRFSLTVEAPALGR
jgi:DNA primase